jgi:hypothetical protein
MPTTRGSLSSKNAFSIFNVKRLWSVVCSIVLCSVVRSVVYQGQGKLGFFFFFFKSSVGFIKVLHTFVDNLI